MTKLEKKFKEAIEIYLEEPSVKTIMLCRDPLVAGTFAVRAIIEKGNIFDFLYTGRLGEEDIDIMELEEVEFESWPPKSSKNNFRLENAMVGGYSV